MSYRDDMITVVLGLWFVVGLFLDAWAHNNVPGLESFFTPWHAVFYTGFQATAAWTLWLVARNVRRGRRGIGAVPSGYALGAAALPVFAVAAVGDLLWHTIFGIEQDLKILFSPTHLVLVSSMVLIVTSPLRSAWSDPDLPAAPTLKRLLPSVLALAFSTTLVLLLLQYANAVVWLPGGVVMALSDTGFGDGPSPVDLASSIVVTNVILLAPLLLLIRRWQVPPATATIVFATVAGLGGAITAFGNPAILVAIVASGVGADLLLAWLRPTPVRRLHFLAFATLSPLLTWSVYLGAASWATGQLPAVVEFWTGIPIAMALIGLVIGVVCLPSTPTRVTVARAESERG